MDNSSEWWCWTDDKYKTRRPTARNPKVSCFLFNMANKTLYFVDHPKGKVVKHYKMCLSVPEYHPISEEEAILLMLKHGFTG